jgi:hypothetical protein
MDDNDSNSGGTEDVDGSLWFGDTTRVCCAVLAIQSLSSSLSIGTKKHQEQIMNDVTSVALSCVHWIARRGPTDLVYAALLLLLRLVDNNATTGFKLANLTFQIAPSQSGKTVPSTDTCPTNALALRFSWRPIPSDPRRMCTVLSLLAERYLYPVELWDTDASLDVRGALSMPSADDADFR